MRKKQSRNCVWKMQFFSSIDKFYTDVISSAVFNAEVQFLQVYNNLIKNYQEVLQAEDKILDISYELVRKNVQKLAQILQIVKCYQKNESKFRAITLAINIRLPDIKKQILKRQITMGSSRLIDNNWKLIKIVSGSGNAYHKQTYKDKYILNLVLYMRQNQSEGNACFNTVELQLTKMQLQQFIIKLKQIKKQLSK